MEILEVKNVWILKKKNQRTKNTGRVSYLNGHGKEKVSLKERKE